MRKPHAVIIKLDSVTGLQTSRILARYGIPVIGIADDPRNFCCSTNTCEQVLTSNTSNEELIDTLIKLGKKLGSKSALFPCSDDSVFAISIHRELLGEWYGFVLSDHEVIDLLMDKVKLYRYLERGGFPTPPTYFIDDKSDIKEIANNVSYPCIVKPPRSVKSWTSCFDNKVLKIQSPEELYTIHQNGLRAAGVYIIQEWVNGKESDIYQYYYYFDKNHKPIINHTSRKLRQWPIELGEASLVENCLNEPVPRESIDIYSGIHYKGIISLEIKIDQSCARHYVIEPDVGRPNTSIGQVEASGVPILYTMYCDALDMLLPSVTLPQRTDVKWISFGRDLLASMAYYIRGELTFQEWLKSIKGVNTFAVLSLRDPMPSIIDAYDMFKIILRFAGRRLSKVLKKMPDNTVSKP
jgi:predicted ATP-grasp superfamily ATP-dependent carboligase